jgi:hypothetical protein
MNSIFYHDYNLFFLFQFFDFKILVNLSPKKLQFLQNFFFSIFTFVTKFVKLSTRCKNLPPPLKKNADHNYCNEAILATNFFFQSAINYS